MFHLGPTVSTINDINIQVYKTTLFTVTLS